MEGLRKRLLASALAYYQEFIEQRRSDPDAQAELRDTTRRVETILADLAVLRAAGELYLLDPAVRARRPAARRRPAGEGGRALRPRRQALDGGLRRPRPPAPAGRARAARPGAGPRQRGGGRRDPDARRNASASARSPSSRRGRPPSGSRRSWRRLGLTPEQRERIRAIEEEVLFGQMREMQSGGMPGDAGQAARAEARRWNASSPCSPQSRRDAGTRWPASRSAAR